MDTKGSKSSIGIIIYLIQHPQTLESYLLLSSINNKIFFIALPYNTYNN